MLLGKYVLIINLACKKKLGVQLLCLGECVNAIKVL